MLDREPAFPDSALIEAPGHLDPASYRRMSVELPHWMDEVAAQAKAAREAELATFRTALGIGAHCG